MKTNEYVDIVEKKIFRKGAAVSSWYSKSRSANIGKTPAELVVRGNMAVKGFLLSRMWAWQVPAWETLAVVFSHRGEEKAPVDKLKKLISSTEGYMSSNNIKWSWLVYVSETGFDREAEALVRGRLNRDIGIMLVNPVSREFTYNNVMINKHGTRIFKP